MNYNILNYGGGWQTTGMLELIPQGKLPRPDPIVIAEGYSDLAEGAGRVQ